MTDMVMAEQFIGGGEYTVAILGDRSLPAIRIEPATEFYDYDAKYFRDDTRYLIPCGLRRRGSGRLRHRPCMRFGSWDAAAGGGSISSWTSRAAPYFLEVNTLPGMTSHSLVPMAARAAGMDFDELVLKILEQARMRRGRTRRPCTSWPTGQYWLAGGTGVLCAAYGLGLSRVGASAYFNLQETGPRPETCYPGAGGADRAQPAARQFLHPGHGRKPRAFEKLPWVREAKVARPWPIVVEA